jgi:hypothetical protein
VMVEIILHRFLLRNKALLIDYKIDFMKNFNY